MPVVGETVMAPDAYRAAITTLSRRSLLIQRVAGGFIAMLGVIALFTDNEADPVSIPGLGLLLFGLTLSVLLPWRALSITTKRATPALGPWHYEVTEAAITIRNPLGTYEWPWRSLKSFDDHPQFWLAKTPLKNQSIIVLKGAFSASDQEAVAALGRRMTAAPAG